MKKNIKIYNKLISLALAGSFVLVLSSCGKKNDAVDDIPNIRVIEEFKGDTALDEIFSSDVIEGITSEEDLLGQVTKLEECLKMSEELHDLNLDDYKLKLDSIEVEEVSDLSNYEEDLKEYNILKDNKNNKDTLTDENITFYKLVNKLKNYEKITNNFLVTEGYDIAAEYSKLAVKSIVYEACGFDDINRINDIKIPANPNWKTNIDGNPNYVEITTDGNVEKYFFKKNSVADDLVNRIYNCQENSNKEVELNGTYNQDRNNILRNTLNETKITIPMRYILDNKDRISTNDTEKSAEALIENKAK